MKIGIFGSYGFNSIGDKAILLGLLNLLQENGIKGCDIYVYSHEARLLNKEFNIASNHSNINFVQIGEPNDSKLELRNLRSNSIKQSIKKIKPAFLSLKKIRPVFLKESIFKLIIIFKLYKETSVDDNFRKDIDLLIIGGGNLLMDLFFSWPFKLIFVINKHRQYKIPFIFYGVGAGPFKSFISRLIFKNVINSSRGVWVRDNLSKETIDLNFKGLLTNINLCPDIALSLPLESQIKSTDYKKKIKLGLNLLRHDGNCSTGVNRKIYSNYLDSFSLFIEKIVSNYNIEITFLCSNTTDLPAVYDLLETCKEKNVEFQYNFRDDVFLVQELLGQYDDLDVVIATRLHAAILALIKGCSVLCLSYQPKVGGVLEHIGLKKSIINIEKFLSDPDSLYSEFEKLLNNRNDYKLKEEKHLELKTIHKRNIVKIFKNIET